MSVQAHRTGGVTGFEGRKGPNGVGDGIGVGSENGDGNGVAGGNGDVNGHGDGDGAGAGMGTGVEVNEGAQDGDGDGAGTGTGTGTGVETRRRTPDENGDGNGEGSEHSRGYGNRDEDNGNGNEDRIGEGGREAKKRKKPQKSCRRHVENGGDLGRKRGKCRKERDGPVAANTDNLENNKEAGGGEHKVLSAQVKIVQVERVCPLYHVWSSEGFVISSINPPWEVNASGIE